MPDDEPGEPTWIDLDAPEPRSTRSASSASRRGWSFSLIAVVAVLGIVAAALLWPDGERADEEVSLGDESGVREHSLVALTDAGDLVELSSATGEQTAVIVESVVPDASRMSVSVTPDGATAYVGRSTSEIPDDGDVGAPRIVAVDTRSGEVTPVTVGAQPAVSPDGRWLALVQPLDPASVEVLDLDDSEAPPIAIPVEGPSPDVPTVVEGIAWSLDSRQLYIASAGRTHVGIDLVEASSGTRTAGWSWAGEGRAAPASFLDDDTVALVDPRGGAEARVVALEVTPVADESPSPTTVPPTTVPPTSVPPTSVPPTSVPPTSVPSTTVPGEGPPSPAAVPVPGAPTSTFPVGTVEAPPEPPVLRELFDVDGRIDGLTSPPEGGQLAVVMTSGEAATSSRLLRWTEDEGLVELAEGVVAASWGPEVTPEPEPAPPPAPEDDAGTVYAVDLDGDLVELSGETGEERRVVAERLLDMSIRAGDAESRWSVDLAPSPDGRTLYVSDTFTEPNVRPVIEAVDLVTGERRDVAEGSGAVVSPDGSTLAYAPYGTGQDLVFHLLDLGSGGVREILVETSLFGNYVDVVDDAPIWRPDGQALYFQLELDGNIGGLVVDLDDAAVQELWYFEKIYPNKVLPFALGTDLAAAQGIADSGSDAVIRFGWSTPLVPLDDERVSRLWRDNDGPSPFDEPALFEVGKRVLDASADPTGGQVFLVLADADGPESLARWTEDDGVVPLADDVYVATWAPSPPDAAPDEDG